MEIETESLSDDNKNKSIQPNMLNNQALSWLNYHLRFLQVFNLIAYVCDLNFKILYCQGAIKDITGYDEKDFLEGLTCWEQLLHPEDLTKFQAARKDLFEGRAESNVIEYRIISGNGQIRWLNELSAAVQDENGKTISIDGFILDVTRRKVAEEQSSEREAHLDSILNSVQDVIWSVTPDTFELLYINPAAEKVYGCQLSDFYRKSNGQIQPDNPLQLELLMENFSTLLQRGWFETEFCLNLPDGQKRWLHRRAHFARDAHGAVARIDGIDTDITSRKQAEDTLKYLSRHDSLTGLGNRWSFEEELEQIDSSASSGAGLIICDIDGLKTINDRLGHAVGDRLLMECAGVLKSCFGNKALISRIGGDEFTMLFKNSSPSAIESAANRLRLAIASYNSTSPVLPLSISIGQAFKISAAMPMSEVFRQADNLMYQEKASNHQHFQELFKKFYQKSL